MCVGLHIQSHAGDCSVVFHGVTQQVCELRNVQWWEKDMAGRKHVLTAVLGGFTSCGKGLPWGFGGKYCLTLQGDNLGHVDAEVIERMCGLYRNFWGHFGQSQLGNWTGGGGDTACTDVVGIGRFTGIRNWLLKWISWTQCSMLWFWISIVCYHEIYCHVL
jgi:hypothetical protein